MWKSLFLPLVFLFSLSLAVKAMALTEENMETIPLGDLNILVIRDADVTMEKQLIPDLNKYPEYMASFEKGSLPAVAQVFFLRDGDHNILFDTGWGKDGKVEGKTLEILQKNGISPGSITDVLLTHMDLDHIGGLVRDTEKVFPQATLWLSHTEFDAWKEGRVNRPDFSRQLARKVLDMYKDKIRLFNFGEEILPGITAIDATGHTLGHTAYEIKSGNDKMIIAGDIMHIYQVQLPLPQLSTVYDMDQKKAQESRTRLLEQAVSEKALFAGMHFPLISPVMKRGDGGFMMREPRR